MKAPPQLIDPSEGEIVRVRRRQSRAVETRSRMLTAAMSEFAHKGYEGASTREIAKAADVRHALLIYHFQTKRGIWEAVMTQILSDFHEKFEERLAGLSGVDDVTKLQLLQADFIRMAAARPELHWLMSHEAGEGNERITWIVESYLSPNLALFTDLIRSAQKQGRYVAGDAVHLHYVFLGAAARIFMLAGEIKTLTGRSPFDAGFIEEHVAICHDLFYREPSSPAAATEPAPARVRRVRATRA